MGITKKDKVRKMFDSYVVESGVKLYSYDHPFRELWNTLTEDQVKRLTSEQIWEYLLKDRLPRLLSPALPFGKEKLRAYDQNTAIIQNRSRFLEVLA